MKNKGRSPFIYMTLFLSLVLLYLISKYSVNFENFVWYETLKKPFFTPPSWAFGIVWSILYGFMTVAAILVARFRGFFSYPMYLYYLQLVTNALYTPLFFGCHSPILGLICTLLLLVILFPTVNLFMQENKIAGILLIPYLTWTCFAAVLGIWIVILNY